MTATIAAAHTHVTDNTAVNLFDKLLILRDQDGFTLCAVDLENTFDDIPLGEQLDSRLTLQDAISRASDHITLADTDLDTIRAAFDA